MNAQPATVTGADGLQVSYSYDSFGRLASENTPGIDTTFSYVACVCWGVFDVYYRQEARSDGSYFYEVIDILNRSVGTAWMTRGGTYMYQFTEHDTAGRVARVSRPFLWGSTIYWVDYTYDLIGRVIEEDAPISEASPYGGVTTTTQYLGESVWVTDSNNHTTKTEMNAVGQIVKVTDAASQYATYTYKPFGELASMTDAESNTTTISYDARGFKSGMSDPNMGDWSYAYSLYGELASQTNALSQSTTLTYDEAGRLYQRSETEGTTTWTYYTSGTGAKGKPSQISAPGSYAEYFWYDTTTGQPSQHQRVIDSVTYQYNMTYDGYGRLNELTYPTSTSGYRFEVDYDYDAYGHLQYVKDGNESYTYYTLNATDALGRPTDVDLGNGRSETWDFDKAAGYLENIQTDGSVQNLTMTYDEVGNVLTRQDSLISKTESFGYDAVNRLTSSQVTGQSSVSIAYSAAGRVTSKTGLGSYSYGAGSAGPFAVTSANSVNYTYDANGRMITRGSGEIDWYSYDLPAKIDDLSDSSYTEFWYGPDRSRIKQYQSASGATTVYAGLLFEFEDASTDTYRHYVQAGDKVVAVVERVGTTNTRQYLHRDHQGSVVKVTDASGSLLQSLAFDAWGLRRNASDWSALGSPFAGSHETERGYTGHEHLDTVGLIHMNGRVQDPILGRFISADPLVPNPHNTQSHNRYSYVRNNPASLIDPSGFTEVDCQANSDACIDTMVVTGHCGFMCGLSQFADRMGVESGYAGFREDFLGWIESTQRQHEQFANENRNGVPDGTFTIGSFQISWNYRDNFFGRMLESGDAASIGVGLSPAGVFADIYTAGTGEDYFTGEEVPGWMRAAVLVPGVSELRKTSRAADAATSISRLKAFERAGIETTDHFRNRLTQRAGRGITERNALDAYQNGRLFYNEAAGTYIRHSSRTGVSVVTDAPSGGRAITVFEGNPSPSWNPVPWRPGQ